MKLAGWLLLGLGLVAACGDNKPPAAIDAVAVVDARLDSWPDAFPGTCAASDQCTEATTPACCLFLSPGGAGYGVCQVNGPMCEYVSCHGAGDPCKTAAGEAGTCTSIPIGLVQQHFWVCQ